MALVGQSSQMDSSDNTSLRSSTHGGSLPLPLAHMAAWRMYTAPTVRLQRTFEWDVQNNHVIV